MECNHEELSTKLANFPLFCILGEGCIQYWQDSTKSFTIIPVSDTVYSTGFSVDQEAKTTNTIGRQHVHILLSNMYRQRPTFFQ